MWNRSYNSLGLSLMITMDCETPGAESTLRVVVGEGGESDSNVPIPPFIRRTKALPETPRTRSLTLHWPNCLNTKGAKKMYVWMDTLSPQTKSGFSGQRRRADIEQVTNGAHMPFREGNHDKNKMGQCEEEGLRSFGSCVVRKAKLRVE